MALTLVVFFYSDTIATIITAGAGEELRAMISEQLKIMSPIMFVGGIIGILFGVSNVYDKFLFAALSPTVASIVIIAAVLLSDGQHGGVVLAWSTLVGTIFQLLLQIPIYFQIGFKYRPNFDLKSTKIKKLGEMLFPAILGCSVGQINIYVDMFFASYLAEGSWSAVGYANRIFQFPVGVMVTAMLVPLFPVFSSLVGKRDWDSLRVYFHKGLNSLWFMAFPILALLLIFSADAIQLLFERGSFDKHDTLMVTECLMYLSLAIVPYVIRDLLVRIFYAFDDTKIPFYIAIFSILVKAGMNFVLVKAIGIGGITLSTTIVSTVNCILLLIFIKPKIDLELSKAKPVVLKIIAATLIMTVVAIASKLGLASVLGATKTGLALNLIISSSLAFIVYFVAGIAIKLEPAQDLAQKIFKH